MITNIKRFLLISSSSFMLLFSAAVPLTVSAACNSVSTNIAQGASQALPDNGGGGQVNCGDSNGDLNNSLGKLARKVVNVFSFVIGAIAVIMIIYGGFRYITSGGSSEGVGAAKNTLIYAIIGLIIVALAQVIVQFVLTQSNDAVQ